MDTITVKEKVKEARLAKGLSQEALAEMSNISLRTIQRIEKGSVTPRLFTLQTLAKKLDIDISNLTIRKPNIQNLANEISILKKMNLSILATLIIPLGNIIIPLMIWKLNGTLKDLKHLGGKIISFQIIWTVATVSSFLLVVFLNNLITGNAGNGLYIALIVYLFCLAINVFIIAKNTIQLNNKNILTMSFIPNFL